MKENLLSSYGCLFLRYIHPRMNGEESKRVWSCKVVIPFEFYSAAFGLQNLY